MRFTSERSHLLVLLARPSASMHHPGEVRLDPGSSIEAEAITTEVVVFSGKVSQFRLVRLVDDDFSVGELSKQFPSGRRSRLL